MTRSLMMYIVFLAGVVNRISKARSIGWNIQRAWGSKKWTQNLGWKLKWEDTTWIHKRIWDSNTKYIFSFACVVFMHSYILKNFTVFAHLCVIFVKSKRMWARHVSRMGEMRNLYKILAGKPRHRWEESIKQYSRNRVWIGLNWFRIGSRSGNEPSGSLKAGNSFVERQS
jgi:hypothetical protein